MSGACPIAQAEALLRATLGPGISAAAVDPQADHPPLLPAEAAAVAQAVPRRRAEFAAGRAAARRAMAALGLPPVALPARPDRAPHWPAGVAGSIAHCETCCIALAARSASARGLGVDVEPAAPLSEDLWNTVLRPQEIAALAALPAAERGLAALLRFSAKEAAFKAQYPLSGAMLDFTAMQVDTDAPGRFAATFTHPAAPFVAGDRLAGIWFLAAGLVVTAVVIR